MSERLPYTNDKKTPVERLHRENSSFLFLKTKIERLTTALYMVSQLISESEPLRSTLRTRGVKLLSRVHSQEGQETVHTLTGGISEIISLLDVAYHTGHISQMNWNILRREYMNISSFLEERDQDVIGQGAYLDENAFHVDSLLGESASIQRERKEFSLTSHVPIKDKAEYQGQKRTKPPVEQSSMVPKKKDGRRMAIMALLKKQKNITVRDVTLVIPEVSEKTLQRELISLVREGVLKREGERRWSTYSLVEARV